MRPSLSVKHIPPSANIAGRMCLENLGIFIQDYLVFGSDLGFRSQMFRFSRNIASTARSYSGKTFTHIK